MDSGNIVENTLRRSSSASTPCYFAIAAIGLNVQFGYTGLLNFGQAAFMACRRLRPRHDACRYCGISMWWGIALGIVYAVVLGLLMGIPTLRLRADYLAIVTIAVAEIVRLVVRSVRFTRRVRRHRRHPGLRRRVPAGRRRPRHRTRPTTYGLRGRSSSPGRRPLGADRRLVARRDLRRRRLAADAQPVGPRAQGDPRGRGRRAQPRQERLQLQDAGADHRRRDRHASPA